MTWNGSLIRRSAVVVALGGCLAAPRASSAENSLQARPPWTSSRIVGSPEAPDPYRLVAAFPKVRFQNPTCIEQIPGARRLMVTEMAGAIFSLPKRADVASADLVGDLRKLLPPGLSERGLSLFDAEFHPDFLRNRYLFVCYVH